MSDYKLVPVEPTPEMVEAAEDAYMPFGDMELAIQMAVLAAPAVQGEPEPCQECGGDGAGGEHEEDCAMAQPDDDAVDRFAAAMKAKLNKKRREGRGGWQSMTAEQLSTLLHEHVRKGDPVDVANLAMMLHQNGQRIEQQPAPDVAGLVEALSIARDYVFSSLEEKKLALAGYPQMWRCEQDDLAMIDATLSAYRKETSHDK